MLRMLLRAWHEVDDDGQMVGERRHADIRAVHRIRRALQVRKVDGRARPVRQRRCGSAAKVVATARAARLIVGAAESFRAEHCAHAIVQRLVDTIGSEPCGNHAPLIGIIVIDDWLIEIGEYNGAAGSRGATLAVAELAVPQAQTA